MGIVCFLLFACFYVIVDCICSGWVWLIVLFKFILSVFILILVSWMVCMVVCIVAGLVVIVVGLLLR